MKVKAIQYGITLYSLKGGINNELWNESVHKCLNASQHILVPFNLKLLKWGQLTKTKQVQTSSDKHASTTQFHRDHVETSTENESKISGF